VKQSKVPDMMEPVRAPPVPREPTPPPSPGQAGLACSFCGRALHGAFGKASKERVVPLCKLVDALEISVHTTACAHEMSKPF
jgi:hypothetical protein